MTASSALPSGTEFVPRGDVPQRIHQIIDPWVSGQPNAPALLQGETVMSFGQLDAWLVLVNARLSQRPQFAQENPCPCPESCKTISRCR